MQTTQNPLDFAIEGRGFFKVTAGSNTYYSRAGNFGINEQGQLVLGSAHTGWVLDPNVTIPENAVDVTVSTNGDVQYRTTDQPTLQSAGQINLSTFINPDGLLKIGDNLYQETDASGTATEGIPGDPGLWRCKAGFAGSLECRAGSRVN